jgi:hypothetical protein
MNWDGRLTRRGKEEKRWKQILKRNKLHAGRKENIKG